MARQNWKKLGLLFCPDGQSEWAKTHAALPVAVATGGNRYRVYVTCRDAPGRSHIGHFELGLSDDTPTVGPLSGLPSLSPGPLGVFDDSGAMTSWVCDLDGRQYHYYTGWNLGVTVPFYLNVGVAISEDGGSTMCRFSEGPILARSFKDPVLTASPCVLRLEGLWKMWYVSAAKWIRDDDAPKHYYHIRYAESHDGLTWHPTGRVCIDFKDENEYAISRPCVLYESGGYRMWFSHRGTTYRIGYAESQDGILWNRRDQDVGLDVSSSGWDSEMIEYPFVFRRGKKLYMLYNGNGYGRTGIGLAVLDD